MGRCPECLTCPACSGRMCVDNGEVCEHGDPVCLRCCEEESHA